MNIIIASSDKNIVEERVLVSSLINSNHYDHEIKIFAADKNKIFNWNRSVIEKEVQFKDISLNGSTAFTFARFLIPLIYYNEDTIVIDPDVLVFQNMSKIFNDNKKKHGLFMRQAYKKGYWATSVMAFTKNYFEENLMKKYKKALFSDVFSKEDKIYFTPKFVNFTGIKIHKISKNWNSFDHIVKKTNLVHFTNLYTQPWVFKNHPLEYDWVKNATIAYENKILTDEHINSQLKIKTTFDEGTYAVRSDLKNLLGNAKKPYFFKKIILYFRMFIKDILFHSPRKYFYSTFL